MSKTLKENIKHILQDSGVGENRAPAAQEVARVPGDGLLEIKGLRSQWNSASTQTAHRIGENLRELCFQTEG